MSLRNNNTLPAATYPTFYQLLHKQTALDASKSSRLISMLPKYTADPAAAARNQLLAY